jgi:capsid protein
MFGWFKSVLRVLFPPLALPASAGASSFSPSVWDGEKYAGGMGPVIDELFVDYWALRARSAELFEKNIYARGLVRRLITNEINTGLHLEATPDEGILGVPEDSLGPWSEDVENRFHLWEKDPWLCDHQEQLTYGALQQLVRLEALVEGDVLIVLRQQQSTRLPRVQVIKGSAVQSPSGRLQSPTGNRIVHGVELDSKGRHVAFWITQQDGSSKRQAAWGEKSGRRLAWLVYGTDKRVDDVRGKPFLGLMLQSLKEIDRYRDSVQRKAVINSILAIFIKKGEPKMGTRPMAGGAHRRGTETAADSGGTPRRFRFLEYGAPGLILDELQHGEEPHGFQPHGTDEKFGDFEEAILQTIAWACEYPPEILRLSFSNNYSASQAAINELKLYLNRVRTAFGDAFCQPIYVEWLVSAVLSQKVKAPKLLESWRNDAEYDTFGAWTSGDWSGHVKPAVDASKLVRGYSEAIDEGLITRDRAARELNGTKYSKNVKKLARENAQLVEAKRPLLELENLIGVERSRAPLKNDEDEKEGEDEEQDDEGDEPEEKAA